MCRSDGLCRAVCAVVACLPVSAAWAADVFDMGPGLTSLAFVTVDNPGNPPDATGFGAVDYTYGIGRYPVTAAQYTAFLNAVAAHDTHGLYNSLMWSSGFGAKIQRGGSFGNYTYSVAPDYANRPVNIVSWGSAARFANWLTNGQPTGAQDSSTTEDGSYFLNGVTHAAGLLAVTRRSPEDGGRYYIPTEDEWYKAAFHGNDGATGNYWPWPTGSDAPPGNLVTTPDPGNNANFYMGGYAVGSPYWRTEVGVFANSAGPYGTFDQGGNVWEWNESVVGVHRVARGGSFVAVRDNLHASVRLTASPTDAVSAIGFRVVELHGVPVTPANPPSVTLITPADGAVYALNEFVVAEYHCEDEGGGSDLVSCEGTVAAGGPVDTATVGDRSFTVTAVDHAGNSTQVTQTYQVVYDFVSAGGFGSPVANPPSLNVARAGSTVPVKWRLPDGAGGFLCDLDVVVGLSVQQVDCHDLTSALGDPAPAQTAGNSGLRCQDGEYLFNWRSDRSQAGRCYRFILSLDDGSEHEVWFSLR